MPPAHPAKTAVTPESKSSPTWLPSRRFFAAVIAIAGMQLMATLDGTIAIVALPKIQNELSLSDAGRSWVITAYVLTFGGLMLLGGRLADTIGFSGPRSGVGPHSTNRSCVECGPRPLGSRPRRPA